MAKSKYGAEVEYLGKNYWCKDSRVAYCIRFTGPCKPTFRCGLGGPMKKRSAINTKTSCIEHRKKIVEEKGAVCSACGCKDTRVLDLHHIDRKKKKFSLSINEMIYRSIQESEEEQKKCILLCKNCHFIVHLTAEKQQK